MTTVNITNARKDLSESDWSAIQETLFLGMIPGMTDSILKGTKEPLEDCIPEELVEL